MRWRDFFIPPTFGIAPPGLVLPPPELKAKLEEKEKSREGISTGMAHLVKPGEVDLSHGVILYLEDISVSFDGFKALNSLSLAIDAGELRCIIGPNGAGKTTMMDVITG